MFLFLIDSYVHILPIFFLALSQFSILDESVICLFFQKAPLAPETPLVLSVRLFLLSRTQSCLKKMNEYQGLGVFHFDILFSFCV